VDKFKDCQKQTKLKNTSKERSDYLRWILNDLDTSHHPIDKRKTTDYYVQNRAIEFDLEECLYHKKDYWNMSDSEIEEEYSKTIKKWEVDEFLSSREPIKFIAAPFDTGKTSFAKYTVMSYRR